MRNQVQIAGTCESVSYSIIEKGQMFRCTKPMDDNNVYMKMSRRSLILTTGEDYEFDGGQQVVPLKKGTIVKIVAGD